MQLGLRAGPHAGVTQLSQVGKDGFVKQAARPREADWRRRTDAFNSAVRQIKKKKKRKP